MKYLLILCMFVFVGVLIYRRVRPYIKLARHIFGIVHHVQSSPLKQDAERVREVGQTNRKLVRCAGCGVWLPASRALALRSFSTVSYCSTTCVERATKGVQKG